MPGGGRGSGGGRGGAEREAVPLLRHVPSRMKLSGEAYTREHPHQGALYNKEAWLDAVLAGFFDPNLPRGPLLWSLVIAVTLAVLEVGRLLGWSFSNSLPLSFPADAHSFVGPPLGFLLVFRLSNAYERWSDGRQFIGKITTSLRLLAGHFGAALGQEDPEQLAAVACLLKAFIYSTRDFLRLNPSVHTWSAVLWASSPPGTPSFTTTRSHKQGSFEILRSGAGLHSPPRVSSPRKGSGASGTCRDWQLGLSPDDVRVLQGSDHGPLQVAEMIRREALSAHERGAMHIVGLEQCEEAISELVRGITGCERILTTRMPYAFVMHLRAVLIIFLCTLPPVLLGSLGPVLVVPAQLAVAYAMLGIEAAAVNCEEPFGYDLNDIPLNKLCAEVALNVDDIVAGWQHHLGKRGEGRPQRGNHQRNKSMEDAGSQSS